MPLTITTKFQPNDVVHLMHKNRAVSARVQSVSIVVAFTRPPHSDVKTEITYRLGPPFLERDSNDTLDEKALFDNKEALLAGL